MTLQVIYNTTGDDSVVESPAARRVRETETSGSGSATVPGEHMAA